MHIFSNQVNVSSILSLENTEVAKPGLLSLRACRSGSYHLSRSFLKLLLSYAPFTSAVTKPLSLFSGLLHMLFLLTELTAALVPGTFQVSVTPSSSGMPTLMGLRSLRDTHAHPCTRIYQTQRTLRLSFVCMRRAFPPGNS